MNTATVTMTIDDAIGNGAPKNLRTLAVAALKRGWHVDIAPVCMASGTYAGWVLSVSDSLGQDARTGRYVWEGRKWDRSNVAGYRETLAFYATDAEGCPMGGQGGAPVADVTPDAPAPVAPAVPVTECAECADGSCVDCTQEAADRQEAEAFRVKATKAHDRVMKGAPKIAEFHARAVKATERAEAAKKRADVVYWAEHAREGARIAQADALVWSQVPGTRASLAARLEYVSATFEAGEGAGAEASGEADQWAEWCNAAAGESTWERTTKAADGTESTDDVAGTYDLAERAETARKEVGIEFGTFEHTGRDGKIIPASLGNAEPAAEIICAYAADMPAMLRDAEASAVRAEYCAEQVEAWADAAEAVDTDAVDGMAELFAMGAPDARQVDLARAHHGVSDQTAERVEADALAAQVRPVAVMVADVSPVESAEERTERAQALADARAEREREAAERAARIAAGDAVRASWDERWSVRQDADGDPVQGIPVRLTRGNGKRVDVTWAGTGEQCWTHCPDSCPAQWSDAEACTCEPYPVVLVDGPSDDWTWTECARCAAKDMGIPADVMDAAAVRSAVREADTVDAARVADDLYEVAAEFEERARADRATAERVAGESWWADPAADAAEFRALADAAMADGVACASVAEYFRGVARRAPERAKAAQAAYVAVVAECAAHRTAVAEMRSRDRMEREAVPHGNATAREAADMAAKDLESLMSDAARAESRSDAAAWVRGEILPQVIAAREACEAYDGHRFEEARAHAMRTAPAVPVVREPDARSTPTQAQYDVMKAAERGALTVKGGKWRADGSGCTPSARVVDGNGWLDGTGLSEVGRDVLRRVAFATLSFPFERLGGRSADGDTFWCREVEWISAHAGSKFKRLVCEVRESGGRWLAYEARPLVEGPARLTRIDAVAVGWTREGAVMRWLAGERTAVADVPQWAAVAAPGWAELERHAAWVADMSGPLGAGVAGPIGPKVKRAAAPVVPAAPVVAPDVVSDPGGVDAWEADGGAGVEGPAGAHHTESSAPPANGALRNEGLGDELGEDSAPRRVRGLCEACGCREVRGERCDGCGAIAEPVDGAALRTAWIGAYGRDDDMYRAVWWCDTDCATCADGRECADCPTCTAFAAPYPARWARRPQDGGPERMVHVCHGPGGMSEGQRLALGGDESADVDAVGIEINEGAAETARAAGYTIIRADVRDMDPRHPVLMGVKRMHFSTPCPTISTGGKRSGVQPAEVQEFMTLLFSASEYLGHYTLEDVCGGYGGPHDGSFDSACSERMNEADWDPSGYEGKWYTYCNDHDDTDECGDDCITHIETEHCGEGKGVPAYTPDEFRAVALETCADERTALMAEILLWPMVIMKMSDHLEYVTMEQSDNLLKSAAPICAAIQSELRSALEFEWVSFQIEDAATYGAASHRVRTWMIASRYGAPDGGQAVEGDALAIYERQVWGKRKDGLPDTRPDMNGRIDFLGGRTPLPALTVAQALGWESGLIVDTRGVRKVDPKTGRVKGGGSFSADTVAQCVTATWYGATLRRADQPQGSTTIRGGGRAFTQSQMGVLVGFRADYPWRHVGRGKGIRNMNQQTADAVSPFMGMAVTGATMRKARKIWYRRALAYQRTLYAFAVNLWTEEQRALVAATLPEDALAAPVVTLPRVKVPPVLPPTLMHPMRALPPAPVRLALTATPAPVIEHQAADTVGALGWCRAFADVVQLAADGRLYPEDGGKYRALGSVGSKGRPVKAERVRLLIGGGFLALDPSGLMAATADGREALRLVHAAPDGLISETDAMTTVRKAKRRMQAFSHARQEASALACLPYGDEATRRAAAERAFRDQWAKQAEESRKDSEAVMAGARIKDRRERRAAEEREAAKAASCRECRGVYPVEARCGKCRDAHAMGLPLVDFLALPPGRAPLPDTGRNWWQSGERVTLAGRAGRTTTSRTGKGVRVVWDDAAEEFGTWEDPAALWAEGREPVAVAGDVIAPPVVPVGDVAPVVIHTPAVRVVEPLAAVPYRPVVDPLADAFAALDAELDAARDRWDALTPA